MAKTAVEKHTIADIRIQRLKTELGAFRSIAEVCTNGRFRRLTEVTGLRRPLQRERLKHRCQRNLRSQLAVQDRLILAMPVTDRRRLRPANFSLHSANKPEPQIAFIFVSRNVGVIVEELAEIMGDSL